MNGAKDGLSSGSELTQEADNVKGRLRVQSRGRFV
jgi:hypothetical protein